jgi:hypothetical protein
MNSHKSGDDKLSAGCLKKGLYLLLGAVNGTGVAKRIPNTPEQRKQGKQENMHKETNRFWLWNYLKSY